MKSDWRISTAIKHSKTKEKEAASSDEEVAALKSMDPLNAVKKAAEHAKAAKAGGKTGGKGSGKAAKGTGSSSSKGPPPGEGGGREGNDDASDDNESSECSTDGEHAALRALEDDGFDVEENVAPEAVPVRRMHILSNDERLSKKKIKNGYQVYVGDVKVGQVTTWARGIACKCFLHGGTCRLPALRFEDVDTDDVIISWLLKGLSTRLKVRLTATQHVSKWSESAD